VGTLLSLSPVNIRHKKFYSIEINGKCLRQFTAITYSHKFETCKPRGNVHKVVNVAYHTTV
jgi:hypothetical protein